MNNFRNRLVQFMQGRYGPDDLFYVLSVIYTVLVIVNIFARSWIIHIIGIIILAVSVFRLLSRNIPKRYAENQKAMKLLGSVRLFGAKKKNDIAQNKKYYFKRCPNCGRKLRLPRVKGRHSTRCPACGCEFSVNILRGASKK